MNREAQFALALRGCLSSIERLLIAMDAANVAPFVPRQAPACTCPSGDGSLRWPCPEHPAQAAERCQHAGQCHPGFCPCQAQQPRLLSCPFCGSHVIAREGYHMTCLTCGAEGTEADEANDEAAAAAWNRRAKPTPTAPPPAPKSPPAA